MESDSTQISPAATRLDDTRGGVYTLTDRRDRTGKGETGPGEGVVNASEGKGVHRGAGSHRQEIGASSSRYHTHNNRGHRAATSFYQRAPSERVELVRGTSSYIHPPGRPPGPLVTTPEVARDADRSPGYRTVTVLSAGVSLGGGNAVIALPTSLQSTPLHALPPPQHLR